MEFKVKSIQFKTKILNSLVNKAEGGEKNGNDSKTNSNNKKKIKTVSRRIWRFIQKYISIRIHGNIIFGVKKQMWTEKEEEELV